MSAFVKSAIMLMDFTEFYVADINLDCIMKSGPIIKYEIDNPH